MIENWNEDERDLADVVFDEIPFVKEAYQEYVKDKEEINWDERYYGVCQSESKYGF